MTAMVTQRGGRGGLEAFRKSWLCGECGGRSPVSEGECVDCGCERGGAPRVAQSFALNNQGNGSVVNNVLVVGGNMDNSDEHYHVSAPEPQPVAEPRYEYRMVPQPQAFLPEPRQLSAGERALITGANVATWASVFVLVPAALFFIFLIGAGVAQLGRVIPH